jgi:heme-degrading monooxygenase HmoA
MTPNQKVLDHLKTHPEFYISITGLRVKHIFKIFLFWNHAIKSKRQADKAAGMLQSEVQKINGIHHTITIWESKQHMKAFLYSGAHAAAIKNFRKIATGKTFGYESKTVPTLDEVHQLWMEKGRDY